ncbi:hypothetical protein NC653_026628 [Populus alba x Populus x berolinensis]|uniref:Uncharacterized protein n=1 Tax=Populus alba x Populus x berolinensis TaxID=444605 RepID=A0AAD6MGH9_9ROSI|nr:hypothetical protein NC653_026628 [Populus alba x Populus x berolinensis]
MCLTREGIGRSMIRCIIGLAFPRAPRHLFQVLLDHDPSLSQITWPHRIATPSWYLLLQERH